VAASIKLTLSILTPALTNALVAAFCIEEEETKHITSAVSANCATSETGIPRGYLISTCEAGSNSATGRTGATGGGVSVKRLKSISHCSF